MSDLIAKEFRETVGSHQESLRIDLYLVRKPLKISRSQIQKLFDKGYVVVNDQRVRPSYKIHPGDKIFVQVPSPRTLSAKPEAIPIKILHEDRHLAVIDKPAGLVVHAAAGQEEGTLVNALLYHLKDLSGVGGELKPGIVHRLDKGTSGVMLVAKTNEAHLELSRQFQDRSIEKTYLALAYGDFRKGEGLIESSLGRSRGDRKKFSSRTRKGREAMTHWKVLKRYPGLALLEVKPKTGRTHQIRVHLAEAGHPVVGDPLYGGKQWIQKLPSSLRETIASLDHQALHAWKIRLRHPVTQKNLSFEAAPPEDLKDIIEVLDQI